MTTTLHEQTTSTEGKEGSAKIGEEQLDVLEELLKPEVQESLITLVEHLPKLSELTTMLTQSYDFVNSVRQDDILYDDLVGSVKEFAKPVEGKVKEYASAAIEANDRTKESTETTIGLFGIIRMLKEPQVQQTLHFAQAYLNILSERQKQKQK